jgi:hypothetical protein
LPKGKANRIAPVDKRKVPIMAGNIPPLVIPLRGNSRRKDRFNTLNPFREINTTRERRERKTIKTESLKRVKPSVCLSLLIIFSWKIAGQPKD